MIAQRHAPTAVAARLREWLLRGPVQLASGEHAGGIVGSFTADGRPAYVYGEITGYWLHWIAGLTTGEEVAAQAQAAVDWVARCFANNASPATRIHLVPAVPDWRNDAVFLFDLAMLARGLAAAQQRGLCGIPPALAHALGRELSRFHAGGELLPLVQLRPGAELPDRWSTRTDAFLVKAATRVLGSSPAIAVDTAMLDACAAFVAQRAPLAGDAPVEMLHPTLYYLEGLLASDASHWSGASRLLTRLLSLRDVQGQLPESPPDIGPWRSDVIAQALRVGVFLRVHDVRGAPSEDVLEQLVGALAARLQPDGSMPFRMDVAERQPNVWCAMFAEQALRWHAARSPVACDPALLV